MISDQQYLDWLADDQGDRVVLVEAVYDGGVEYFASSPYISQPGDTDPNRPYDDLLLTMGDIHMEVGGPISVGDLVLINDGSLDGWIGRAWRGHPLRIWMGDAAWSRDDFRLEIDGINGGIEAPQSDRIEFVLYDQGDVLDQPLQATRLADGNPVPVCYGTVFNAQPVLIDAVNLTWQVHDGAITSVAVRDNGAPITPVSTDLTNGKFTLGASPVGTVTCTVVQADSSAAAIVTALAGRISGVTVDAANFATFPNTAPLGYYADSETTVGEAVRALVEPLGAVARFNRAGELQLIRIGAPGTPVLELTPDDIAERGLRLLEFEAPRSRISVGYFRNWHPQIAAALAGIADPLRLVYGTEWLLKTATNSLPAYPLADERRIDSLLMTGDDAQAEADRRASLRSTKRERWRVDAFVSAATLELGSTVTISYPGYGFDAGRDGVVTAISKNLLSRRYQLEIFL